MTEVSIIGIDLAKSVFQLHGAAADGSVAFRKKLSRLQVLPFLSEHADCIVAMEACSTAHDWAREIAALGHETKLIPPQYVKPYLKRQKNDAADAEAIAEAASRPTMRFVEVKSADQQARAMVYRTRQMFVRQRTQSINALRSHLAEHGVIGPKSKAGLKKLAAMIEDETVTLPPRFCRKLRLCMESLLSPDTVIQRAPKIAGKRIVRVFRIVSCGSCARLQCHPVLRRLRGRI